VNFAARANLDTMILGTVPYLNALPLIRTLQRDHQIVRAVPSVLAPQLARGECDAALIPVVEWFRGTGEEIVSDACIASSREVTSVLLLHRVPLEELKTVALDSHSRTSVALLDIILRDLYKVRPKTGVLSPDLKTMLQEHDGALLIGDPALEARAQAATLGVQILDLGAAWTKLTGLPFVYAAWVSRRELNETTKQNLAEILSQARDEGVKKIDEIARENPTKVKISQAEIRAYLGGAIEYFLTAEHRAGLDEFRRRCKNHGLI